MQVTADASTRRFLNSLNVMADINYPKCKQPFDMNNGESIVTRAAAAAACAGAGAWIGGASVWLVGRWVASLVRVRERFSEALPGGLLPINSGAVRIAGISSKHDPVIRE